MRVHHLNCGTLNTPMRPMICHVLLLEISSGLILVDTGLGTQDIAHPGRRLGPFRHVLRPALDPAETALRQIEAMGHHAGDVRHILLTHADPDHVGGLSDFPNALVHIAALEMSAMLHPITLLDRTRYRKAQWEHGPQLRLIDEGHEAWHGIQRARRMREVSMDIWSIPLPGHSRGQLGYAIDTGTGWLLHAGDAFYDRASITRPGAARPLHERASEALLADSCETMERMRSDLHGLSRRMPDLEILCSHDPAGFAQARDRTPSTELSHA